MCAIIVVITTLVLVDNNKFGGEVILENLAYDVALSVRQTQVYGIAVERFGTNCSGTDSASSCFNAGYGMYFSLSSPSTYILFADESGTGIYNPSVTPSEIVESDSLDQGYAITGLCVIADSGSARHAFPVTEIDILIPASGAGSIHKRGAQAALPVSCVQDQSVNCNYEAQITLTSPKGDKRTVIVDATGQMSVQLQ